MAVQQKNELMRLYARVTVVDAVVFRLSRIWLSCCMLLIVYTDALDVARWQINLP